MHAYDDRELSGSVAMKAVWIVDDDRSIRWVLEKALSRSWQGMFLGSAFLVTARKGKR